MRNLQFANQFRIVLLYVVFTLFLLLNSDVHAQEMPSQQYEIIGQDTVYSQFIPLYGTFSVEMEYAIPIEVYNTELVHAGTSFDILITANKPGKITTTFFHDEKILDVFEDELRIGEEKFIEIPESWIGQVFAMPHIQIKPTIVGPATITPEWITFDSETTKKFRVFADDDIGIFDSIQVELGTIVKMKNGGNLNLAVTKIPLGEHISDIQSNIITKQISLKKIVSTNLHLQIKQSSIPGHIQIKTNLSDDLQKPIDMDSHSIDVYVDGVPMTKIIPNKWSEDVFVGDGTHNLQARFPNTRDSNNIAIDYSSADSSIQTITVISNNSSTSELQCVDGMILKDNKCVKDESKNGLFGMEGGGCLIATAAYGSELAPQVQFLREIRDDKLMGTESGASFMTGFNEIYYSFSPYIADYERENPIFKEMVRVGITPMLTTMSLLQFSDDSEHGLIAIGSVVIALNIGMYVIGPMLVIKKIHKFKKMER